MNMRYQGEEEIGPTILEEVEHLSKQKEITRHQE